MEGFTPTRLVLARMRRGLRQQELAERCGVDPRSVRAWEKGEWEPDEESLRALARVLRFPLSFFSAPSLEPLDLETASFRSLTTMRAAQRDAVHAAGTFTIPLNDWIESRFRLPAVDVPHLRDHLPELAATALRGLWNLGQGPAPNMVHLLELHGVRVFSAVEQAREFDAFSFWHDGKPFVMLNTTKSGERGRFDAAHELGHLVLHRDGGVRSPESEQQADRFASAFLMPQEGLLAKKPRAFTTPTILALKVQWQVSAIAMAYRLAHLGAVTDWHYRELMIDFQRRGWRSLEPHPMRRETSQILGKVFGPLQKTGDSPSAAARSLHLPPDEVQRMIFGLVLADPVPDTAGVPRAPSAPVLKRPKLQLVGGTSVLTSAKDRGGKAM